MHELFAEALYLCNMPPPQLDHWVFTSVEVGSRFEDVTRAQWQQSLPFIKHELRPGGSIARHYAALRSRQAHVRLVQGGRRRSRCGSTITRDRHSAWGGLREGER